VLTITVKPEQDRINGLVSKRGLLRHASHRVGAGQNLQSVDWRFNLPTLADPLCSRNARSEKGGRGTARPSFLLAEAARSKCAPSMRAVKDSLAAPLRAKWQNRSEGPRSTRAVEDQSAPIPEERTSEPGGIICNLVRRPYVDQHACPSKRGKASKLGRSIAWLVFSLTCIPMMD